VSRWRSSTAGNDASERTAAADAGRVLFLDRDGVVIADRHYISSPLQVSLIPNAAAAMARARRAGWRLIGISNQSGIGRGCYTETEFAAVQRRVDQLLAAAGTGFDAFYYCPHDPGAGCRCRKPQPGLLEEAARSFPFAAGRSWFVGDKVADMVLALAEGLGAIMVRTGQGERERLLLKPHQNVRIAADLAEAVSFILAGERA
jgi:D-glycero-D-manno-heptose 1,7-bisphosphate phosphatase